MAALAVCCSLQEAPPLGCSPPALLLGLWLPLYWPPAQELHLLAMGLPLLLLAVLAVSLPALLPLLAVLVRRGCRQAAVASMPAARSKRMSHL